MFKYVRLLVFIVFFIFLMFLKVVISLCFVGMFIFMQQGCFIGGDVIFMCIFFVFVFFRREISFFMVVFLIMELLMRMIFFLLMIFFMGESLSFILSFLQNWLGVMKVFLMQWFFISFFEQGILFFIEKFNVVVFLELGIVIIIFVLVGFFLVSFFFIFIFV